MSRVDDPTMFKCGVCRSSQVFDRKFLVRRHILEQHSGFAFMCSGCQMIYPRQDNHSSCTGKYSTSRRMEVIRRSDGLTGVEAEEALEAYKRGMEVHIVYVEGRSRAVHRGSYSLPRAASPERELSLHPSGRISPSPRKRRRSPSPEVRRRSRLTSSSSSSSSSSGGTSPKRNPSAEVVASVSTQVQPSVSVPVQSSTVKRFELMSGLTLLLDVAKLKEVL